MRIISFDPGGTTGVAAYDEDAWKYGGELWTFQSLGPEEHHEDLWVCLDGFKTIVYERFNYQRRELDKGVSLRLDSVEYIGVIKLFAQQNYDVTLHPQQPADRLFWDDDKLRKLSLWRSSPHERDAVRHLLTYVSFKLKDQRFIMQLK